MCNFFSCIVTSNSAIYFTEDDSHETIIERMPQTDDYVRVEYNAEDGYKIDQRTIPEWYERIAAKAEADIKALYTGIQVAWAKCDKVRRAAWVEHEKALSEIGGYLPDNAR